MTSYDAPIVGAGARLSDRTLTEAHVLVADDEASIVRLFVRALQSAGYSHVHGTTDSAEVLGLVDSFSPDLVVMDLNMPGLDGFALLEELSGLLSEFTCLPVLTVSGISGPEAKERAFRAGAKDYLVNRPEKLSTCTCSEKHGQSISQET